MNALTLGMCEAMLSRLSDWASDESIACVVIDGDGERAFCAGGDVVAMVAAIRAGGPRRFVLADRQFDAEYRLVQAIAEFPKPVVAWVHGITMGAGVGLAVAASHRVVTPSVRMAMPESRIGLFPDVGAAHFLGRVVANAGPLIAAAGIELGANDALLCGLADDVLPDDAKAAMHAAIDAALADGDDVDLDRAIAAQLSAVTADARAIGPPGEIVRRIDALQRVGRARDVAALRAALVREASGDDWFASALSAIDAGSPTSIHVGFEHFRRSRRRSLRQTLAVDGVLARAFVRGHEFPEGVRAALIDKDRRPDWQPPRLDQVTRARVAAHFAGVAPGA
jgi:enoyl-CoA hydratase/carnithine racemase